MTNRAVTDLAPITTPFANDYILIVHNAGNIPTTNLVTVNNFANSVVNYLPYATPNTAGVFKVGTNLTVNTAGYLSTTIIKSIAYQYSTAYTAKSTDDVILVDQVVANNNCTVILPSGSVNGKTFTVKVISDGGFATTVVADNGSSFDNFRPSFMLSYRYTLEAVCYNNAFYVLRFLSY